MRSFASVLIVSLAVMDAAALDAQMSANSSAPLTPSGWAWITDSNAEPQRFGTGNVGTSKFEFTHMAPGWHITMGPGGVLYPQTGRAEGRFVLDGEMIVFKDGSDGAE